MLIVIASGAFDIVTLFYQSTEITLLVAVGFSLLFAFVFTAVIHGNFGNAKEDAFFLYQFEPQLHPVHIDVYRCFHRTHCIPSLRSILHCLPTCAPHNTHTEPHSYAHILFIIEFFAPGCKRLPFNSLLPTLTF